jgi:uncharacterized membrane protein HdeD (DUF308 family)
MKMDREKRANSLKTYRHFMTTYGFILGMVYIVLGIFLLFKDLELAIERKLVIIFAAFMIFYGGVRIFRTYYLYIKSDSPNEGEE